MGTEYPHDHLEIIGGIFSMIHWMNWNTHAKLGIDARMEATI